MSDTVVDREARLRLDRVETNQRDLERALALLQREQAVTAEVLRGLRDGQEKFLIRMTADEKATNVLEKSAAVTNRSLVFIGAAAIVVLTTLAEVLLDFFKQ